MRIRPGNRMPEFVHSALVDRKLVDAYDARPWYQRNDYLGWITQAKRDETIHRRLTQMLDELERGDLYMKMPYKSANS